MTESTTANYLNRIALVRQVARDDALEEAARHIERGVKVHINRAGFTYGSEYAKAIRELKRNP